MNRVAASTVFGRPRWALLAAPGGAISLNIMRFRRCEARGDGFGGGHVNR